jgi:hypothetical protein
VLFWFMEKNLTASSLLFWLQEVTSLGLALSVCGIGVQTALYLARNLSSQPGLGGGYNPLSTLPPYSHHLIFFLFLDTACLSVFTFAVPSS